MNVARSVHSAGLDCGSKHGRRRWSAACLIRVDMSEYQDGGATVSDGQVVVETAGLRLVASVDRFLEQYSFPCRVLRADSRLGPFHGTKRPS